MQDDSASSVYGLVGTLCETLIRGYFPNEPKVETCVRRFKSKAYEILLKKSKKPLEVNENVIDPLRELNVKQFEYRIESRQHPELIAACDKFEECLNFIQNESFCQTDTAKAVLSFLIAVSESNPMNNIETPSSVKLLVPGPFTLYANYDTTSHYPPKPKSTTSLPITFKSFELLKNFQSILCDRQFKFGDDLKSISKPESTFSFLTPRASQKKPSIVSVANSQETWNCGLKVNPSSYRFFNLTCNSASNLKLEGTKKIPSSAYKSATSSSNIVAISDVSRHTLSWSWESLGHVVPLAPNFVSETDAILQLHSVRSSHMGSNFEAKIMRFDQFLIDLKNLVIGIQSDSFKCDDLLIFHMEPNITISGISPQILEKFITSFMECGSCYKRLQLMIANKNFPFLFDGFIFKATCNAVEEYLVKFRQFVVLLEDNTLVDFYKRMKKMMKQICYLAHIFAIHPDAEFGVRPPMGSQFLGYLYKEITNATQKDIIMLLVYILKQCCYAYFKYLQKWIFHGILDDPRNELFICFVDHYRVNTKYFFDKAYFVRKESVPGFLQGFEDQILQCGKYTMLLKTYDPNHAVFSVKYPSISVCLSFEDIQAMEENCRTYIQTVKEVCGKPVSAKDIFEERKRMQEKFQEMVLRKSRQNFERWSVECENQAAEETAKKRKRLEELQAHLKEVRERKIAEKKTDLALDLKVLKEAQEIEDKRVAQETLETQKRIEHYQILNAIVEERKQRNEVAVSSSQVKIETDPGTPVSTTTDFESCLDDEDQLEEDVKSLYEDVSTSTEFFEKFLETEKKLNEYIEATNNNKAAEIKRSASDILNSNEEQMSEFQENKAKVLGSSIQSCIGNEEQCEVMPEIKTVALTDAQKIKIKVLSSEFGIDFNQNETVNDSKITTPNTSAPSELEINRKKMMRNDPFTNLNEEIERPKLQLDLNTERSRNRRRVLESEYNIITGANNTASTTPMSTTSDSPMIENQKDDITNGNVLKLIVPSCNKTPDIDILTGTTIEETPECALNTAGIINRRGFNFESNKSKPCGVVDIINMHHLEKLPLDVSNDNLTSSESRNEKGFHPEFKWKLVSDLLSWTQAKTNRHAKSLKDKKVNELNVITLTEFLQKSVAVPLCAHLEVMNCEIMKLYLRELDILGHFKSLRNYFLLMDGEFGSIVCDELISKLENGSQPNELLSYRMLHSILDNALGSSNSGTDKNADNLSFIVSELPEKFDLTSSDVLSSLSLSYRVAWPVNLILNPETLERYSSIFRYLIKVRRISWILEESYQKLKETVKKNGKEMLLSPQYRCVQQIRHKLFHFVHALNNHITSNALQASWKTFKDELGTAMSVEDIYRKHATYVKRILFLCMLNKKSIEFHNAIENIFKVTLRFSRNLKSREWKRRPGDEFYKHSRYEKLLADEIEFEKVIKYTIYLGNKIVRHGYQEEIGEFISLINFNQYYLVET